MGSVDAGTCHVRVADVPVEDDTARFVTAAGGCAGAAGVFVTLMSAAAAMPCPDSAAVRMPDAPLPYVTGMFTADTPGGTMNVQLTELDGAVGA
jgi:hypothetical protein